MNKAKGGLMTGIIYAIIFAIYNLFVFMVFTEERNNIFWISYVFMVLAYAIHIACVFSIIKNISVKTMFFGIPLLSFSIFFVAAEFFVSLVFMIFRESAGTKLTIFIQALLLAAFLIIAIVSIMTRDAAIGVSSKIKENVNFINSLKVDVEMMEERSTDAEVKNTLKKLAETIRYSDPMSNSTVAMQEQMILQGMTNMRGAFDEGNMQQVLEYAKKIELLFIERNKKIMISK